MIRKFAVFQVLHDGRYLIVSHTIPTRVGAVGWAKERAEFNQRIGAAAGEYTVVEIVPLETVKWKGGEA